MGKIFYGIDFGTTNSSIAVLKEDGTVEALSGNSEDGKTVRSVLFFPLKGDPVVGDEAIRDYIKTGMEGRLLQSIKWVLPEADFFRTEINFKDYSIEELVAMILKYLKEKADRKLGKKVESVILGRPVAFSEEDDANGQRAEKRLKEAAEIAGFKEVHFQMEPIAAGFAYEQKITEAERAIVIDLGGGSTDLTIMRLDPKKVLKRNREEDILATTGIYLGGNDLTSELSREKMVPLFGGDTRFESWGKWLPIPGRLLKAVYDWKHVAYIKSSHSLSSHLKTIYRYAQDREMVEKLKKLIEENLSYQLFLEVQQAKHRLSTREETEIHFSASSLEVCERIKQGEFSDMITSSLAKIDRAISKTLSSANLAEEDIDVVFATGGTSYIPTIMKLLEKRFPHSKIHQEDAFMNVAKGLALSALHL